MPEPLHLLLIESESSYARPEAQALAAQRPAWQIEVADSVARARELLASRSFDVVLVRQRLRDGSALDLADALSGKPVILAVAEGETLLSADVMEQGFSDYLVKDERLGYLQFLGARLEAARTGFQRQRRLRHDAERFEFALAGADVGLWDRDLVNNRVFVSAQVDAMLGFSAGEIDHTVRWKDATHPDDWERVQTMVRAHLRGETPMYECEYRIRHKQGHWVWLHSRAKVVERDAAGAPLRLTGTFMDITERKLAEAEIERLAFYDPLTHLPNRRLLMDRMTQALAVSVRSQHHGALLFIDLDNFKDLNDTQGHDMGDQLLRQVANRLVACIREGDTAARFGGDEFIVMLENLGTTLEDAVAQAEVVARKLMTSLCQPYELSGRVHHTTLSIGIALFSGHAQSVDELLKRADLAMYKAKAAGGHAVRFFDPGMQAAVAARAALEIDLRHGLQNQALFPHYQPVVDAQGRLMGVEALARWQHPQRGMVSPAEFIALAERTGLILELGLQILRSACQQLVAWAARPETARLTMSVNVSAYQFRQPDFVAQVLAVIEETGANPYRIKLELTESLLLSDVEDIIARMYELKAFGLDFSLDDFGTGYSSLSYLKRLPLDQLKIDQSFVRDVLTDPNDAAIVRTILALAQSMDLQAVAEGVETEGQRQFLLDNGCTVFQGYLFGRPGPLGHTILPA